MKWYWILAIIIGSIIVIYGIKALIDWNANGEPPITDQISCRPGTCLGTRSDGTQWCSSVNCKKAITAADFNINRILNNFRITPTPGPTH